MFRRCFLLMSLLASLLGVAQSQDRGDLRTRLERVDAATRLDDPALKPWYMKVSFQRFESNGKPGEQGTLEEWWAGPTFWKRTITSPSYTATVIANKDGRFRTAGSPRTPYLLEVLTRQMIHPMPNEGEIEGLTPQLTKAAADGPPVDCVMYSKTMRSVPFPQMGLLPTYCLTRDKDLLQASYDYSTLAVVRTAMGMFQQRIMPIDVKVLMNRVDAVTAHLAMLKTIAIPEASFFETATGMEADDMRPVGVKFDTLLLESKGIPPVGTPTGVNPSALSQPVEVRLRIGTDGCVHWIRLESAPDQKLAVAALGAMVNWQFTPHKVDGKPVEVETAVGLIFANQLGRGLIR